MKHLIKILLLILILGISVTCRKDDAIDPEEMPVEEPLIKQETKTETISATGGTIELSSGVKIEIPADAMPGDKSITIETIDPFLEENDNKIAEELNGAKVSAIVRCGPDGTTFTNPVKITIPYFTELLPDDTH